MRDASRDAQGLILWARLACRTPDVHVQHVFVETEWRGLSTRTGRPCPMQDHVMAQVVGQFEIVSTSVECRIAKLGAYLFAGPPEPIRFNRCQTPTCPNARWRVGRKLGYFGRAVTCRTLQVFRSDSAFTCPYAHPVRFGFTVTWSGPHGNIRRTRVAIRTTGV